MGDFPNPQVIGPVVSTESIYSFGGRMFSHTLNSFASALWTSGNLAMYVPFELPCPFKVKSMFLLNGTAVSGNIDLGVLSINGTLILSTGSTAQAGTSTLQLVTVSETLLSPGAYYFGCSLSNASTAQVLRHSYGQAGQQVGGILKSNTTFPLANNPTMVITAAAIAPVMGIASITSY